MKKGLLLFMVMMLAGCTSEKLGEIETISEMETETETVELGSRQLVLEADQLTAQKKRVNSGLDRLYEDTLYEFQAGKADASVLVRSLHNGDKFVMLRLEGPGSLRGTVPVEGTDDYYFVDWTKNMPERDHNDVTGVDPTKPPAGLLRFKSNDQFINEFVVSHSFTSRTLNQLYGSGRESTLRELVAEKNTLVHSKEGISFSLEAKRGETAEQWFLLAEKPLFSATAHLDEWITFQKEHYKEVNNWFTVDGPIKKLPWSVEPFTKNGYGRYLGTMIEKEAIDRYFKYEDRYFYNLTLQSAANLWEYRESKQDVIWKTEYTSTWLKQKYEITAPYVDTRHNELIAMYLYRIGRHFDVPELEAALVDYSDYLLNLISIGNVIPAGEGYYPADYYSPQQGNQLIHASLNHALGEANMFIEAYEATGEKKYLLAARNIRKAIEATGDKWIRPNGDLWYQINQNGSFAGGDYELLTLNDLKRHEKKWKELGGKPSPILQKLIESKEQYLNSK